MYSRHYPSYYNMIDLQVSFPLLLMPFTFLTAGFEVQELFTLMTSDYTIVNCFVLVSYLRIDKSKTVEINSGNFFKQYAVLALICRSSARLE